MRADLHWLMQALVVAAFAGVGGCAVSVAPHPKFARLIEREDAALEELEAESSSASSVASDAKHGNADHEPPDGDSLMSEVESLPNLNGEQRRDLLNSLRKMHPDQRNVMLNLYRFALSKPAADTNDRPEHPQAYAAAAAPRHRRTLPEATSSQEPQAIRPNNPRADANPSPAMPASAIQDVGLRTESWHAHVDAAIGALEGAVHPAPATTEEALMHADLRLLYLLAGRRSDALRPIDGLPTTQQDFWIQQIYSLSTMRDARRLPDAIERATQAGRHLDEANARLAELSMLAVRNMAFCTRVDSFGVYEPLEEAAFKPGERVLLYAEIENFKSDQTEAGYTTALESSYQIFDQRGTQVAQQDFGVTTETCRNRRRDFFMRYFIDLPTRIYDGRYTLKLSITDVKSQKIGQSSIELEIK